MEEYGLYLQKNLQTLMIQGFEKDSAVDAVLQFSPRKMFIPNSMHKKTCSKAGLV